MLIFYHVWVLAGLALFYFGPIPWPGADTPIVALYVLGCLLAFDVGVLLVARRASPKPRQPVLSLVSRGRVRGLVEILRREPTDARHRLDPRYWGWAWWVVIAHALLSLVYLFLVTGRNPLNPFDYSLNFGQVYAEYVQAVSARESGLGQQVLILAKAALFPAALVAVVKNFRARPGLVIVFVTPLVVSSLFRGTDKEVADIAVLVLVCMACHRMLTRRALALLAVVPLAGLLFVGRRVGRFGGSLPDCLPGSTAVCFDYSSPVARIFGERGEVLWVFASNYVTNGYQGLATALQLPWHFGFGLGHLPPLKRVACLVSSEVCNAPDYQSTLTEAGWDASARWTTVYPVLANDFSFWLVPLWLVMLGAVFQLNQRLWRDHSDPIAGASLVLVTMFWVYSSANMQIAISLDWTAATLALLYLGTLRPPAGGWGHER